MNHARPRYLLAKRSIDDRAFDPHVKQVLLDRCVATPRIVEAGCGTGNTVKRLLDWGIERFEYCGIDTDPEIISFARRFCPQELRYAGVAVRESDEGGTVESASFTFEVGNATMRVPDAADADLLIAQAFADLVPPRTMVQTIEETLGPMGLAYLPITFDGGTVFSPVHEFDELVERAYHRGLKRSGQYPHAGRRLINRLHDRPGELLAVGGSDWIVRPVDGRYPADERYFLSCILEFVETVVDPGSVGMETDEFANWMQTRRNQLKDRKLIFATHQYDLLYQMPPE